MTAQKNGNKLSALMAAAEKGDSGLVGKLIGEGADVNAATLRGVTALMIAAMMGKSDVVRLLATHGADVNAKAQGGKTPLMYAAVSGSEAAVRALLENGADVNAEDKYGRNVSDYATEEDVVKTLQEHGAKSKDFGLASAWATELTGDALMEILFPF